MLEIGLIGFGRWGKLIFRDLRALSVSVHVAVPGEQSRTAAMAARSGKCLYAGVRIARC